MVNVRRILVATDFSEGASRALEIAAYYAGKLSADLLLVHVHMPPTVIAPDGYVFPDVIDDVEVKKELRAALERTAERTRVLGAPSVEPVFLEGQPWSEILRLAKDRGVDLIVLGTHGRSGLPRLLLGSVADKVIRNAPCPVLAVGPKSA